MNTQAKVAIHKQKHPEYYCHVPRCLWRTMICDPQTRDMRQAPNCSDGYCPRHKPATIQTAEPKCGAMDWIRNGYQFPGRRGAEFRLASSDT